MNEMTKEKCLNDIAGILKTGEMIQNQSQAIEKFKLMKKEFQQRNQWDRKPPVKPEGSVKEIDASYRQRLLEEKAYGSFLYHVAILTTGFVCVAGFLYLWKGFLNPAEEPEDIRGIFFALLKIMLEGVGLLMVPITVSIWIAARSHASKETALSKKAKEDWYRERKTYHNKVMQYRTERAKYERGKNLFEQYVKKGTSFLDGQIERMSNIRRTTQLRLQKQYEESGIYPKYRNKEDLLLIAHYLLSGICAELCGPHGAYGRLEWEKKMNTIIVQHDMIYTELQTHTSLLKGLNEKTFNLNKEIKDVYGELQSIRKQYEEHLMEGGQSDEQL